MRCTIFNTWNKASIDKNMIVNMDDRMISNWVESIKMKV